MATQGPVLYLARDKDGDLYLFSECPRRGKDCWWAEAGVDGTYLKLKKSLFPELAWEMDPRAVHLNL